jgi:hypothetical protein
MADLKDFVSRVPEYSGWNHAEKIKFFTWFLHTFETKPFVNGSDVAVCYDTLHDEQPSSIAPFLSNMEKKTPKEAIKDSKGYSLVKKVRDEFDAAYLKRGTTVMVEKLLADLPGKIPDDAERVFLEEALTCFRNSAFRAAIVMTWNLTYFHMCQYVLKHKLAEFNAEYPIQFAANHKKAKAPVIAKYEDFFADLQESDVIKICRAANILDKEQTKALGRQIDRRNTAAHPNMTVIKVFQAEEFIHDLIENVVLTLKI